MELLLNILYHLTTALKAPVIIALLSALAWALYELGAFLREWRNRRVSAGGWRGFLNRLRDLQGPGDPVRDEFFRLGAYPTLLAAFAGRAADFQGDPARLAKLISEIELEANRNCYKLRMGIRIAPMLGLMGTLIPMGPALRGLSLGDLESMTGNLIIAFNTTVIGLLIGALCYVIFTIRQHWYNKDLLDLDYLVNAIFSSDSGRGE